MFKAEGINLRIVATGVKKKFCGLSYEKRVKGFGFGNEIYCRIFEDYYPKA